ncbi:MAG TPA: dienelactone hydrolase family protein [Pyrinomonadaceae bacterium]|jgi:carboxymethylenebutenolidase
MCVDCDDRLTRRAFLAGAGAAAAAGASLVARGAPQQPPPSENALNDPGVIQGETTFRNGADAIKGYLARPKAGGRRRAIIVAHGNPGVPEDIRNATAQLAQGGFVGMAMDWNSRAVPDSTKIDEALMKKNYYRGGTFDRQVQGDALAAIRYVESQPFVRKGGVGMLGFCGGGRLALVLAARSKEIKAVVSFYGPVLYHQFRNADDPMPDVMEVVRRIRVPVQGHYGTLDTVAPAADAKLFEKAMGEQKTPVEMFYYEGAGHSFYNYTRPAGSDPGFDYNPSAAALGRRRMIQFFARHLS